MQRERVQDPYPWTWEIPAAIGCAAMLAFTSASQLARSLANWGAGAGWRWPSADQWFGSTPGILAGDASAGLTGVSPIADPTSLRWWLVGLLLVTLTGLILASIVGVRRWGTGRMRGMASITDAHHLLGVDRLWRVRHVVRPDLHPTSQRGGPR